MKKKALMVCSNYWNSPFHVGSHHIACSLVKMGWDVAFISAPVSLLHLIGKTDLRQRFNLYRGGGKTFLDSHLWAYVPGALIVPHKFPLLRSKWVLNHWWRLTIPNVVKEVQLHDFGCVNLLYMDSFIQPCWIDTICFEKSVLRISDHSASLGSPSTAVMESQDRLAKQVDLVVYSATTLEPYVASFRPRRTMYFPNGVDVSHFEEAVTDKPVEYENVRKPIAIYIGAMDYWFDFDLVEYAARRLPDISFVFLGPEDRAEGRLKDLPNLHFLGRKNYSEIPAYLHHADVGLIPFNRRKYPTLIDHIHPLKLYEYLASGLPVVAVDWAELRALKSPAVLCRTADEFVNGIAKAISDTGSSLERIRYANTADWDNRVLSLVKSLDL